MPPNRVQAGARLRQRLLLFDRQHARRNDTSTRACRGPNDNRSPTRAHPQCHMERTHCGSITETSEFLGAAALAIAEKGATELVTITFILGNNPIFAFHRLAWRLTCDRSRRFEKPPLSRAPRLTQFEICASHVTCFTEASRCSETRDRRRSPTKIERCLVVLRSIWSRRFICEHHSGCL